MGSLGEDGLMGKLPLDRGGFCVTVRERGGWILIGCPFLGFTTGNQRLTVMTGARAL